MTVEFPCCNKVIGCYCASCEDDCYCIGCSLLIAEVHWLTHAQKLEIKLNIKEGKEKDYE